MKWVNFKFLKMVNFLNLFILSLSLSLSSDIYIYEAAIYSTIIGDLYIAIGDKNLIDKDKSWTTNLVQSIYNLDLDWNFISRFWRINISYQNCKEKIMKYFFSKFFVNLYSLIFIKDSIPQPNNYSF